MDRKADRKGARKVLALSALAAKVLVPDLGWLLTTLGEVHLSLQIPRWVIVRGNGWSDRQDAGIGSPTELPIPLGIYSTPPVLLPWCDCLPLGAVFRG